MTGTYQRHETAQLLPYPELVETLRETMLEYGRGEIASPERLGVALQDGGVMLSMPASGRDIAIHKLVNVCPKNSKAGIPTIHGFVNAFDVSTGEPLFSLDGPTVTGRRTAAVSMLGIKTLLGRIPKEILIIGAGAQAANHIRAIADIFPGACVRVQGVRADATAEFCRANQHDAIEVRLASDVVGLDGVDVVITVTTSKTPVYAAAPVASRLLVGVGAFTPDAAEIAPETVLGSTVYVDDLLGAHHEAGDLIQANVDWSSVKVLAQAIESGRPAAGPLLFKSVGCAAWDLAACRVAQATLAR